MKKTDNRITVVFDLDETVINSKHRTPNHPDGTLNLQAYIQNHTPENVAKDTLLPLAREMQRMLNQGYHVAVLTARDMHDCDYKYLAENGIFPSMIMSRDQVANDHYRLSDGAYKARWLRIMFGDLRSPMVMFDDSAPVKTTLRKLGIPVLCAHKVNRRLHGSSATSHRITA